MKHFKIFLVVSVILTLWNGYQAKACTSAIVSGKVTSDGRPLMWKNRDTSNLNNCVRHFKGEKYNFIGITGYTKNPRSIWMGLNDAGFAILNTLSYNLNDEENKKNRNGSLMTDALGVCRTVEDFKNFLDSLPTDFPVSANFGVMDAEGHAGYFETGINGYTYFDIDDPNVAPNGYIVRTNYSTSGKFDEGGGYLRYLQAEKNLFNASGSHQVTPEYFFSEMSRSYQNPLMDIDLRSGILNKPNGSGWTTEQDFIARRSSSSAVVIQGVKPGENPENTIMWTSIGYPSTSPFIPLWVKGSDKKLPYVVFIETEKGAKSPLCDAASILRNKVFGFKRGNNVDNYMNWELLYNSKGNGYLQLVEKLENNLIKGPYKQVEEIRNEKGPDQKDIFKIYDDVDKEIISFYAENFDINL